MTIPLLLRIPLLVIGHPLLNGTATGDAGSIVAVLSICFFFVIVVSVSQPSFFVRKIFEMEQCFFCFCFEGVVAATINKISD